MSGSNTTGQSGVYGEKGVASSDYIADSRYGAVGWYDESRPELWLFGGYNYGVYFCYLFVVICELINTCYISCDE